MGMPLEDKFKARPNSMKLFRDLLSTALLDQGPVFAVGRRLF